MKIHQSLQDSKILLLNFFGGSHVCVGFNDLCWKEMQHCLYEISPTKIHCITISWNILVHTTTFLSQNSSWTWRWNNDKNMIFQTENMICYRTGWFLCCIWRIFTDLCTSYSIQWLNQGASALVNSVACAPPWFLILLVVRATAIAWPQISEIKRCSMCFAAA